MVPLLKRHVENASLNQTINLLNKSSPCSEYCIHPGPWMEKTVFLAKYLSSKGKMMKIYIVFMCLYIGLFIPLFGTCINVFVYKCLCVCFVCTHWHFQIAGFLAPSSGSIRQKEILVCCSSGPSFFSQLPFSNLQNYFSQVYGTCNDLEF